MEVVKFDRVVSVNSEINKHNAKNVLNSEISSQKSWLCEKGMDKAIIILQLERATVITSIHIGNSHSAFVEVLVGRASDDSNEYQSLIPSSIFMSPNDSKVGKNPNNVRFFTQKDFTLDVSKRAWDRLKIVCSQPFNKRINYGLCFIKVQGEPTKKKDIDLGCLKCVDDVSLKVEVGSFFAKRKEKLSVTEQIKEAEKQSESLQHTPLDSSKIKSKLSKKQSSTKKRKNIEGDEEIHQRDNRKNKDLGLEDEEEDETVKEREKKLKKEKAKKFENEKLTPKQDKTRRKTKPFKELLEGVTFVLSGFKNPERGNLRSQALAMGAKYMADWEDGKSTHLICAYSNTPKCNQVKGKGEIVRKEWIEKCFKDKIKYPWRKFSLDQNDQKEIESEEEILADDKQETSTPRTSRKRKDSEESSSHSKHKKTQDKKEETPRTDDECYDVATDDEEEKRIDTTDYPMPLLLNIFESKTFYIDDNITTKDIIERYVIAYQGIITEKLNQDVDYYITNSGGPVLQICKKKVPNLVAVQPAWIWKCNENQQWIPVSDYIVK